MIILNLGHHLTPHINFLFRSSLPRYLPSWVSSLPKGIKSLTCWLISSKKNTDSEAIKWQIKSQPYTWFCPRLKLFLRIRLSKYMFYNFQKLLRSNSESLLMEWFPILISLLVKQNDHNDWHLPTYRKKKKNTTWHTTLLPPGICKREVFHSLRQEAYPILNSIVERNAYIFKVINLDYHKMNL
jgi:hypothetical protein